MANQSPDRRQILTLLSKIAAASQFPVFDKWAFAAEHFHHAAAAPRSTGPYAPQFFTPEEYRTLDTVCELMIPADETPGAREAGVPEFVDFMVGQDDTLQYPFRTGLAWLNALAMEQQGTRFVEASPAQQNAMLATLEANPLSEKPEGHEFFRLARQYTVIGYYTSRVGLEELDYPGLRLYSASPECGHDHDSEHQPRAVALVNEQHA